MAIVENIFGAICIVALLTFCWMVWPPLTWAAVCLVAGAAAAWLNMKR